jgi:hypothetical protein
MSDAVHPAEVWSAAATLPPVMQRISRHNDEFRRGLRLSEPTEIKFKSFDGTAPGMANETWLAPVESTR